MKLLNAVSTSGMLMLSYSCTADEVHADDTADDASLGALDASVAGVSRSIKARIKRERIINPVVLI